MVEIGSEDGEGEEVTDEVAGEIVLGLVCSVDVFSSSSLGFLFASLRRREGVEDDVVEESVEEVEDVLVVAVVVDVS